MLNYRSAALYVPLCLSFAAHAEVTRFEVLQTVPAFEGRSFGAVVPFAATRAEREAAGDPRRSLAERYADNAAYVAAVRAAEAQRVAERLLLPQDAERAIEPAEQDRLSQLR